MAAGQRSRSSEQCPRTQPAERGRAQHGWSGMAGAAVLAQQPTHRVQPRFCLDIRWPPRPGTDRRQRAGRSEPFAPVPLPRRDPRPSTAAHRPQRTEASGSRRTHHLHKTTWARPESFRLRAGLKLSPGPSGALSSRRAARPARRVPCRGPSRRRKRGRSP